MEDLKPCPICRKPVNAHEENSPDGTITWVRIHHDATTPCSILFIEDKKEAVEKWNTRAIEYKEIDLIRYLAFLFVVVMMWEDKGKNSRNL